MFKDEYTAYENGEIWLPKKFFAADGIKAALTFEYGSSTYDTLTSFRLYKETKTHIGVPRHFLSKESITRLGVKIEDLRPAFPDGYERLDVNSTVVLDSLNPDLTVQNDAVEALRNDDGIMSLACGTGKTPVALHLWSQHRVPLIVIADNTSILEQWATMIRMFIRPSDIPIGRVYDGNEQWDCPIVLASVQSLLQRKVSEETRRKFGMVIIDEIHKVSAPKYNKVAPVFMGRRLGLTATPNRTDRLEAVYQYHFGPVRYRYLEQPLKAKFYTYNPSSSAGLMEDPTFRGSIMSWGELNVQKVWSALARQQGRTQEIANIVRILVNEGRRVLVISQRKDLLIDLNARLPEAGLVVGSTPLDTRAKVLASSPIVLGIMGIAKEGLNSPSLDSLVLCEPFKDQNLFQQVVGRILRDVPGKQQPKVILINDLLGDGAGPVYGLARALKRLVENWPASKGGPYTLEELKL